MKTYWALNVWTSIIILPPVEAHSTPQGYSLHQTSFLDSDAHNNHGSSDAYQLVTYEMTCTVPPVCTEHKRKTKSMRFRIQESPLTPKLWICQWAFKACKDSITACNLDSNYLLIFILGSCWWKLEQNTRFTNVLKWSFDIRRQFQWFNPFSTIKRGRFIGFINQH